MEVASLFFIDSQIKDYLEEFIYNYEDLSLSDKDVNCAYFDNRVTENYEIYYHHQLSDVAYEFAVNFSETEREFIYKCLGSSDLKMVDISFRHKQFFDKMIQDLKKFLINKHAECIGLILNDPFNGLKKLQ